MQTDAAQAPFQVPAAQLPPEQPPSPRLWPAVVLVSAFWLLNNVVVGLLEMPYFFRFLYGMASAGVLSVLFFGWWWASRRIRFADRLYGFVVVVGMGALVAPFCDPSIGAFGLLITGLPIVLSVWTLWMLLLKVTAISWKRLGTLVVVALTWASFTLVRTDGATADLKPALHWRWSPSAEDLFLAEQADTSGNVTASRPASSAAWSPVLSPGDWAEFRGPNRDGVIRGVTIPTDWRVNPPRLLWRQRVGPAWSSVIVVGDRLFTQEQRGEQEAVVGYDAATGKQLWSHEDTARFWESVSGAGPRATPTFAHGRLFALGGTGILNCLDPATGERHWSRQITPDAAAKAPMWGFAGSPLVGNDMVVVFGGGEGDKNLLAYRADSGDAVWTAAAGQGSYSSPQLATIAGTPQILMLGDGGLTAVDPASGRNLWHYGLAMPGAPRAVQPHVIGAAQLVVGTVGGLGVTSIDVTHEGEKWDAQERWTSTDLKPEFPDFVVHQGHVYGFDIGIFCCIDLATGKRCWKEGRYGRGQVVLLADQGVLLVLSDTGEAILLAADPQRQHELGRFRVLDGKTWNNPVIAHGRLYVRNAEEMACYRVD